MNTPAFQSRRNATMLLEQTRDECDELSYEIEVHAIGQPPIDMDLIYSVADQIKKSADRLNHIADQLMIEYRNTEHQEYCAKELQKMLDESHAN